jgi:hypothetical protein
MYDSPLEAMTPARPVPAEWKAHDPAVPLTYDAYTDGIKMLSPLLYAADAEQAEGNAQAYWVVLHGSPDTNGPPSPRSEWITNGIWGAVCVDLLRTQSRMPKPADVLTLCLLHKPKPAEERKALPAAGTVTPKGATIRTQNMRALIDFQRETTKNGNALIDKGGVRDAITHQCQREGLTGDVLRLTVAIRYAEERMARPRPVMPTFIGDNGQPNAESVERARIWNEKEDISRELQRLRAELAAATTDAA